MLFDSNKYLFCIYAGGPNVVCGVSVRFSCGNNLCGVIEVTKAFSAPSSKNRRTARYFLIGKESVQHILVFKEIKGAGNFGEHLLEIKAIGKLDTKEY